MAQMFINDGWADAQSGRTYDVKNPATGAVIDSVPLGEAADANEAVEALHRGRFADHGSCELLHR